MKNKNNYKKDLKEIKMYFKILKKANKKSFDSDIRTSILAILKSMYDDAIKKGIKKEDIQYLIDYYNIKQKNLNRVNKKRKRISKFEKKLNSLFEEIDNCKVSTNSATTNFDFSSFICDIDKRIAELEKLESDD